MVRLYSLLEKDVFTMHITHQSFETVLEEYMVAFL